ncbi:MAG: PEP-CTERM sorting domain-containing protein [Phenylobacterium sp.]|uniref:PEPxxWA-CTERM sorting domain-containing protein n=1 Tax=Phenylobacterium sp. TaxID=1871053 RepID=UPI0011FD32D5|nr:PEPxxWA-CTERM sorting domain-containing protein [Phenylobacterium sp.]TAJ73136.1 MAG: PEP-CTERM sorting domain-containing protein [Phenylobacterium sp.]
MRKIMMAAVAAVALAAATPAAATVTLSLVDSFSTGEAFGLAYDGSNLWVSRSNGSFYEVTTSGVVTGNSGQGPFWSALAYNSANNKLAVQQGSNLVQFDRPTGSNVDYSTLNPTSTTIPNAYGGLIDGLDIEGGTLWWSPDIDLVWNSPVNGSGDRTLFLGGAGGYSGVEFVDLASHDYVIVVNDALNPRRLCVHETNAVEVGCTSLPNSRYEDLAFDGRYLYAADYFGNRIDKIDLLVDGGSIFDPSTGGVPEPSSWALMILGFGGVGSLLRRRRVAFA